MLYAAYGSNLHPVRIKQRTPSAQLLGTAAIAHQSLNFHKRGYTDSSGKCNIVPCHNSIVYVAVYDIPLAEMTLLDQHEGAGSGYDRASISVDGFGDCVTYIAAAAHIDEALLPFSWYKELVLVGCEKLGFPNSYVEAIRAVPIVEDFEGDRYNANMRLVKACKKWQL